MTLSLEEHMTNLEMFIGDAEHFELADDSTVDITEAYNAFKAMVEEIGRLQKEVRFALAAHDGQAEDKDTIAGWLAKAEAERDRFRAINTEMREMLIILRRECEHYEQAVSGETFNDTELNALILKASEPTP